VARRLAESVALGLLQGPAELLPVSSSAHVELLPWLLGWEHARRSGSARKEVAVALHAGTALTLAVARGTRMRVGLAAVATAPPALAGLLLERVVERRLGGPRATAAGLVGGSVAMVLADRAAGRGGARRGAGGGAAAGLRRADEARAADAVWLGAAQAAALAPGVSRSGATWAAARARGFAPAAAVALSDELALPVLAGAALLKGVRLAQRRPDRETMAALAAGAAAAAASTAVALRFEGRAHVPAVAWAAYRTGLAAVVWAASRR
jgi:undecaprenyl-diphosphatase